MNENNQKYLPIGTVVLLKNAKKRLMITGFCIKAKEKSGDMFDYCGVIYPEGMLSSDKTAVFNHEQIEKIVAIGYSDDEDKEFKKKLKEALSK